MNPMEYPSNGRQGGTPDGNQLSTSKILGLGTAVLKSGSAKFEQMRFPMNVDLMPDTINGVSVITFDEAVTKQKLHDFLFDDITPQ